MLSDLATAQGALRLQRALGGTDEQTGQSILLANRFLRDNPELSSLEIGRAATSFFDHNRPRVGLSSPDPSILAHEIGHAADLGLAPSLYKNTITPYSRALVSAADRVALPAALAISSMMSKADSTKYLNYGSAAAAAAAIPNLYNEAMATHIAASKSNNYLRTVSKLAPGFISHALDSLSPVAKLQAIKYIKDMPRQQQAVALQALNTTQTSSGVA
jgi:hypothetical protein